jgi:hypothetical protein
MFDEETDKHLEITLQTLLYVTEGKVGFVAKPNFGSEE